VGGPQLLDSEGEALAGGELEDGLEALFGIELAQFRAQSGILAGEPHKT
jgi:hypothetical protein